MKKLLLGIVWLLVVFVLKIAFVVIVLSMLGVDIGGFIGRILEFLGLSINGSSLP